MTRAGRARWLASAAGFAALALVLGFAQLDPRGLADDLREAAFDRFLVWTPRPSADAPVMVVDIDRAALDRLGAWPWQRDRLADLVRAIAAAKPSVLVFDMLIADRGGDPEAGRNDPDALAEALRLIPSVLGAALDPARNGAPPEGPPIIVRGDAPDLPGLMIAAGVDAPDDALRQAARGLGVLTLAAPDGGPVRRVPLLAVGGEVVFGGLAVEALRVATGGGSLIVDGQTRTLLIGSHVAPLGPDADLRLWPSAPARRAVRATPALELLDHPEDRRATMAGKIVVIGVSAPEGGELRPTAADPFTPGAQLQADAVEQIAAGLFPQRPAFARMLEAGASVLLAALAILLALRWRAARGAVAIVGLALLWIALCVVLWRARLWLVDPAWPALAGLAAWQAATLAALAEARARRAAFARSFSARLPPSVVARLAADPDQWKRAGEEKEITALVAELEGFAAMTERMAAPDLVALLDRYVERVGAIVVKHGGMVDAFADGATRAFFNAPVDLPDHAARAVDCAIEILEATDALRSERGSITAGMGRARIGVETGRAALGDVGGGRRLDYKAYGEAINLAARLAAVNEALGSRIAVGPRCAALASHRRFRETGTIARAAGAASLAVFEPENG
ncbi:MAG: hypothetical protein BGP06_18975 [Rhizobiales bacterium 65-9]|nr:adenylate/guanylate cyclase domain-containing protein [Hyphomicrobiales bacterium]OJY35063.1 MAG: hypothetical protein BGP06_18975 [Rhizobiales bacterium 65-9]